MKTVRRLVQVGVAAAFVLIPYLNHLQVNLLYGNFLAFHAAGLPLADPLAALQVGLAGWAAPQDLLIGAGIALVLGLSLGTVFCSWICPFGLLSELVFELGRRVLAAGFGGLQTRQRGFALRAGIFGLGLLGGVFLAGAPLLNQASMPGWYSRIFQLWFLQKHVSLALGFIAVVLAGELLSRNRFWCRYFCPQATLPILAKLANPRRLQVGYRPEKCICRQGNDLCQEACSLALNPKAFGRWESECNNCGDCVAACQKMGRALDWSLGRLPEAAQSPLGCGKAAPGTGENCMSQE